MPDDPIQLLKEYLKNDLPFYMDLIRGDNPAAFTRDRLISVNDLISQMLNRKNRTQFSEVMDYYDSMNKKMPVTEKAFFLARRKFNPEAVRVMSNEYISRIYDNYDESLNKWNDLIILGIDGTKFLVPNTRENKDRFGVQLGNSENEPAMALLSTLHDSLNNLKLDVLVDKITGSEKALAARHIDHYCDNYTQPALFLFDRGYVSIRLIDQIINRKQYFLMRAKASDYKKHFEKVKIGEVKELEVTFDRANTNDYRNDRQFRIHLLNTTYRLRFAKVVIGSDEDGNEVVEQLITNLPEENASADRLKEAYWMRWPSETSYNRLKNRMTMEEFSGYKPELILQDIYADAWVYNLVSLKIKEADEKKPLEQKNGRYTVSRNFNKSVGVIRTYLLKVLMTEDDQERNKLMDRIDDTITSSLNWVKNGTRKFDRKDPVNRSAMSYRKAY